MVGRYILQYFEQSCAAQFPQVYFQIVLHCVLYCDDRGMSYKDKMTLMNKSFKHFNVKRMSKSYDTQQKRQLVNKHFFDNRKHIVNLIVSYNFFANYTNENKYNQYLHHLHNLQTNYYLYCLKNSMLRYQSYYSIYRKVSAGESMEKYVVNLSNMYEFFLPLPMVLILYATMSIMIMTT